MAASDLEAAITALDALIKSKAEGATDLAEFYDRRMGMLGISAASSLETLLKVREQLVDAVSSDSGGAWETTTHVGM